MVYTLILAVFGVIPLLGMWLISRRWIGRYVGLMLWLALAIAFVGASWEVDAVDYIWFYAPQAILGPRLLAIPIEEWAYYALDALLAATVTLVLRRAFAAPVREVRGDD